MSEIPKTNSWGVLACQWAAAVGILVIGLATAGSIILKAYQPYLHLHS